MTQTEVVVIGIERAGNQYLYSRSQDGMMVAWPVPISAERARQIVEANPDASSVGTVDFGARPCDWTWTASVVRTR